MTNWNRPCGWQIITYATGSSPVRSTQRDENWNLLSL